MIPFILGVIAIITLLYLHVTRHFNYWKNRNVSNNKPTPFFGNVLSVALQKESISSYIIKLYKSTPLPFYGFFVFDQPFILIRDPELIKNIMIHDFDHFPDRSIMSNDKDKYTSRMIFVMKQPRWGKVRPKVTALFSSAKLKSMLPLVLEAGDSMVEYITNSCLSMDSTNCKSITMKYTIDVISSCAFGLKVNSQKNSKFAIAAGGLRGTTLSRLIQISAHFVAPFLVKVFNLKFTEVTSANYLESIILNTIKERKETKTNRPDLVDLMIRLHEDDPILFDTPQLLGLFIQYLVAGFETSGATIAFALYELCLNISIQNRLRKEIFTVIEKHGGLTYEAIKEITYLQMVIKETLRKYPIVPYLDRRCVKAYRIPNTDVVIDKGIPVYIPVMALHHDEKYFKNPAKFDPERFSPENKSSMVSCTYLPFGEGKRVCLGTTFGMISVSVAIIKILTIFELSASINTPSALTFANSGFFLLPEKDAVFVKFTKI